MREGPVAALPVEQHICPQAAGASSADLQGQVPFLTQSPGSSLGAVSQPVPLPRCEPAAVALLKVDILSSCSAMEPELKQNGLCECPGAAQEILLRPAAVSSPQQEETSSSSAESSCKHLPASGSAPEDSSADQLRIVKHKPSAIVFCDNQVTVASESSDGRESPPSTTEDNGEEDDFPKTLQYKEFLVSRQRRSSNRSRKGLRRRADAWRGGPASGWQKPTEEGQPEFTGSQEEEEAAKNNGSQVGKTRQEESDNKQRERHYSLG